MKFDSRNIIIFWWLVLISIASPALAIVAVPVGDKAASQPLVDAPNLESAPLTVEQAGQDSGSKDSVLQSPQAAESRAWELVTAPSERSKWYVTGGVIKSNLSSYPAASTCEPANCIVGVNDWGVSIGVGYELNTNFLVEGSVSSLGNYSVDWPFGLNASVSLYALKIGGIYSHKVSNKVNILVGGGYSTINVNTEARCSGIFSCSSSSLTSDRPYITAGVSYRLTDEVALRLTWSKTELGFLDNFVLDTFEVALKYNF
jgi:opacity protein-like surface antigen